MSETMLSDLVDIHCTSQPSMSVMPSLQTALVNRP